VLFEPHNLPPCQEARICFSYLFQGGNFPETPEDVKKRLLLVLVLMGINKSERNFF
jgi:hypothetical protein